MNAANFYRISLRSEEPTNRFWEKVAGHVPQGHCDSSQAIPRLRMRVNIRRKPWSVPRLRGRGEQG
jgi:hypothetical protein